MSIELEEFLRNILEEHPDGISEFSLLRRLQREHDDGFPPDLFKDSMAMYRAHFLLFNALYRLQETTYRNGGALTIDPLNIRLHRSTPSAARMPARPDPVRAYYLDWRNLEDTSAEDVERLLGRFWTRYYANERRADALAVLGLQDPVDQDTVVRRYRQLAMTWHPDRGGDTMRFQQLQDAMAVLRRCVS